MILRPLEIAGAYRIEVEPVADGRGSFVRTFDAAVMRAAGLVEVFEVEALAVNTAAGTIRGLHLQRPPYGQSKIVRALHGALFDVIVDVRPASPTFGATLCIELDAASGTALYIPAGCAHGYQTLVDGVTAWYAIAGDYRPREADGIRYDDPHCAIRWPLGVSAVSPADEALGSFSELAMRLDAGDGLPKNDERECPPAAGLEEARR